MVGVTRIRKSSEALKNSKLVPMLGGYIYDCNRVVLDCTDFDFFSFGLPFQLPVYSHDEQDEILASYRHS
jgi:hypothetical protein